MSKSDYIKRYLSDEHNSKSKSKKAKKRKPNAMQHKSHSSSLRIIDVDADVPPGEDQSEEEELYETKEDLPAVEADALEPASFASKFVPLARSTIGDPDTKGRLRYESDSSSDVAGGDRQRRRRYDSDSDNSIAGPQQPSTSRAGMGEKSGGKSQRYTNDGDVLPQGRKIHSSDSDLSPPRGQATIVKRERSDEDLSPPGRGSAKMKREPLSADDLSPPRRRASFNRKENSGQSRQIEDSDSDLSPRRKRRRRGSSSDDLLPDRQKNGSKHRDSIASDNRRAKSKRSPSRRDDSRGRTSSQSHSKDQTPFSTHSSDRSRLPQSRYDSSDEEANKATRPNQGEKPNLGGKTEPIVRKSYQKKKRKKQELTEEQKAWQAMMEERYAKWGKGTKQLAQAEEQARDALADMAAPLARYSDDERMNETLRGKEYEEDPMAAYFKKKKHKTAKFVYPVYQGPPPPENRFKIRPGYRWDGVDRSNGFEAKLFASSNKKNAEAEEYHRFMYAVD